MKSAHQIASDIVDAWSANLVIHSSHKTVLTVMIAEELEKHRLEGYAEGYAQGERDEQCQWGYEATMKEETK